MRIRSKFTLFSGLLAVGLTAAVSLAALTIERRALLDGLRRDQERQALGLAAVCQQALGLSDMLFVINYLKTLKSLPGIDWAYFADETGKIVVHSDERFIYRSEEDWRRTAPDALELVEPVVFRGRPRGTAHIGFSRDFVRRSIEAELARTRGAIETMAGAATLAGLLGAWALAWLMARPIRDLAAASQRVGRGELDAQVPVRSADELGELAAQFNRMTRRLKELDELKDEFISMVSHDLRSPLASIRMHVDYLLAGVRGPLNADQSEMLKVCAAAAASLGVFIDNVLDSAKIKAGRMGHSPTRFKLHGALENVLKLARLAAEQKSLRLRIPTEDGCWVDGDHERVEHILANLLDNAIKHSPADGAIDVSWRPEGSWVRVTIANAGRGIPPEELPRLFERFYQADADLQKKRGTKGTGLGLFIVKQAVEAHGGRVWAESWPGKGAAFHFTLPAAPISATIVKR